ncbi:MAG: amylo-alpha-1,6-glucosidase [Dehalococcoidales bacterium]|nr:amylo-alpha-1,6-glucosidase [Dehalococcoidales bacterium]
MSLIDDCYQKAIEIMKINSTESGFLASRGRNNDIWCRDDSMICLGVMLTGDDELLDTAKRSLITLKERQTPLGQLPNVVYLDTTRVNYYAVDATAWWIIAVESLWHMTGDTEFFNAFRPAVEKAIVWLQYQTIDQSDLIISPPAADWMDSSVQRWSKVFYNNVLYYKAILSANEVVGDIYWGKPVIADKIKTWINLLFWPTEMVQDWVSGWGSQFYEEAIDPNREHYLNYLSFESYDTHCDVLANCLAITWDIANQERRNKILNYFYERRLSEPFPIQVLSPPFFQASPGWNPKIDLYRPTFGRSLPYWYHNGGIWPWVGGLYIAALVKAGQQSWAEKELERLAEANRAGAEGEWEFNEWLHGKKGTPMGEPLQTWNAAGYIIAYKAVTEGIFPWHTTGQLDRRVFHPQPSLTGTREQILK